MGDTRRYEYPKAFDKDSTQLISIYFIGIVSSFNLGFGAGLLADYLEIPVNALIVGIVVWIISDTLEIALAIRYLKSKKDKNADIDVFGVKKL